jgi:putative MATE family efflux protein
LTIKFIVYILAILFEKRVYPLDHTERLGKAPIFKLVLQFSIPTITAMIVNAIYNVVDRMFVGQLVGETALGGLTVAFPVMIIAFAVGALFAIGGATLVSIKLGEKDLEQAQIFYGNMTTLILISGIVMTVAGEIFMPSLLRLVGATNTNLPYALSYMRIITAGVLFQLGSFTMAVLIRTEGKPVYAMVSQLVSAVTNIVLDYLFIGPLNMGVAGAAIATVIGQMVGFVMLFRFFFISKKSLLKLHAVNMRLKAQLVKQICLIGASSFIINLGTGVSASFTNIALKAHGGDAAITSFGAINSLITLVLMPIIGLLQGIAPIMGYNYGMRQLQRVWHALWVGIGLGSVFSVVMFILMQVFPEAAVSPFFRDSTSTTMSLCAQGLRLQILFLPILPISVLSTAYFQSTAQGGKSLFISAMRQGLVVVMVLILPLFWQLTGVWLSAPVAEIAMVIVALIMLSFDWRRRAHTALLVSDGPEPDLCSIEKTTP